MTTGGVGSSVDQTGLAQSRDDAADVPSARSREVK